MPVRSVLRVSPMPLNVLTFVFLMICSLAAYTVIAAVIGVAAVVGLIVGTFYFLVCEVWRLVGAMSGNRPDQVRCKKNMDKWYGSRCGSHPIAAN